ISGSRATAVRQLRLHLVGGAREGAAGEPLDHSGLRRREATRGRPSLARVYEPSAFTHKNLTSTNASSAAWQTPGSTPHSPCAWSTVRRSPGISRNSDRNRASVCCIPLGPAAGRLPREL